MCCQIIRSLFCFPVLFLSLLFVLFGVMTWLSVYPGEWVCKALDLYNFSDMGFKMLLVAVAALNFLICFVAEVSDTVSARRERGGE